MQRTQPLATQVTLRKKVLITTVTQESLKNYCPVKKLPKLKAVGLYGIEGYWFKKLTPLIRCKVEQILDENDGKVFFVKKTQIREIMQEISDLFLIYYFWKKVIVSFQAALVNIWLMVTSCQMKKEVVDASGEAPVTG